MPNIPGSQGVDNVFATKPPWIDLEGLQDTEFLNFAFAKE
jgi:hypothetical protein